MRFLDRAAVEYEPFDEFARELHGFVEESSRRPPVSSLERRGA